MNCDLSSLRCSIPNHTQNWILKWRITLFNRVNKSSATKRFEVDQPEDRKCANKCFLSPKRFSSKSNVWFSGSAANDVIINKLKQQQQRRQWQERKQAYYVNIWYVNWMYLNLIVIDVLHSLHSKSAYEKLHLSHDHSTRAYVLLQPHSVWPTESRNWMQWMMDEVIIGDFRIYSADAVVRRRHGSRTTSYPCLLDGGRFSVCHHGASRLSPAWWQPVSVTTDNRRGNDATMVHAANIAAGSNSI